MFTFAIYAIGVLTGIVLYACIDCFFDIQDFLTPRDPYADEDIVKLATAAQMLDDWKRSL